MWLRWSTVDATPRDAMVLARRTVVAMRLDPQGQPLRVTLNLVNTTDFASALAYPLLNVAMVAFVARSSR